jgi:DNA-binding transcriptional regulator YdaS (Cro superfamily)
VLEKALQLRMAVTLIARATGISRSAVSQWRRVPERHLAIVARITGISERRLRPDLYRRTARARDSAQMAAE